MNKKTKFRVKSKKLSRSVAVIDSRSNVVLGHIYSDFLRHEGKTTMIIWERIMSTLMDYLILFSEFKKVIKTYRNKSVSLFSNSDFTPTPIY